MKRCLLIVSSLGFLASDVVSADKTAPAAMTVFHISGLECSSCVYVVQNALSQTLGVEEVDVVQTLDSFAKVNFNPKVISEHQIAQVVREAIPLHGTPYLATLKVRIPGYSQEGRAAKVKAVFERWKKWVELEVWDEREGELFINFLPLEKDAKGSAQRGWSLAQLTEALESPAPKGLGLKFEIMAPGQL